MNKVTQIVINIVAFIFFFILFTFLFFPFENIFENYLASVEQVSGGKYRVTVGEIKPSVFFKTEFKKFRLISLEGGSNKTLLYFPSVKVGVKYLPLLGGDVYSTFEIQAKKGSVEGSFSYTPTEVLVDSDFNKFSTASFPIIVESSPVDIRGKISGKLNLNFQTNRPDKMNGKVDLQLIDWRIDPALIEDIGLEIPELKLADKTGGKLDIDIKKGKFTVNTLNFPGEDLSLNMDGWLKIGRKIEFSRLKVEGKLGFSEEKQKKLDSILGLLEKQREEDGKYPITISGKATKPAFKIGSFKLSQLLGL